MPGDRPRRSRHAVRPIKWLGKGIGSTARGVWRVVRRRRRNMAPMASISASLMDSRCITQSEEFSDWLSFRQDEPLLQFPVLPAVPALPAVPYLQQQMQMWFSGLTMGRSAAAAATSVPASGSSSSTVKADDRAVTSSISASSDVDVLGGNRSVVHTGQRQQQQQYTAAAVASSTWSSSSSSRSSVQLLGAMLTPKSTFPMLLQTVSASSSRSAHNASSSSSSSSNGSSSSKPQQLLTVGCRHWSNWLLGNGLLKVKIYDFAIYVDAEQAERLVPALTDSSSSTSTSESLPDLLKSQSSGVGMSLLLRAARDIPLHMLSEEYEKVLNRRLARAGGDNADTVALQQLLATFSTPDRLPAAVRGGNSSSGKGMAAAAAAAAGAAVHDTDDGSSSSTNTTGGSVAKGAMLVFERCNNGTVTARVGPHVLGSVQSPKLAEALFDLYLGDQPVSEKAKDAAAQTLNRIALQAQVNNATATPAAGGGGGTRSASAGVLQELCLESDNANPSNSSVLQHQPYYLPQSKNEQIRCEGAAAAAAVGRSSGGGKAGQGARAVGLSLSDLAACALHVD